MDKAKLTACFLLGALFLSQKVFPQEGGNGAAASQTIPEILRIPERSEAPRYPKDLVIGELGKGASPDKAYELARKLLAVLISGSKDTQIIMDSGSILTESLLEEISSIEPRAYRIGGGRIEADGSVSFLVRFLGYEESISGELYLRQAEDAESLEDSDSREADWLLDDLILEEKRNIAEIKDSYRYDFSPYERFY